MMELDWGALFWMRERLGTWLAFQFRVSFQHPSAIQALLFYEQRWRRDSIGHFSAVSR